MKSLFHALLLAAILTAGCDKKIEAPPRRPVNVGVVEAQRKDAPVTVSAVGHVTASRTVALAPQVTGLLAAAHFSDGERVREGQKLFTLDQAPFAAKVDEAKGALGRDWAKALQSTRDFIRYKDLVKQGVVSQNDYDQRQAQYEADWRQVQSDQGALETARINLGYCSIVSPVAGVAGYQQIRPGNPVSAYTSTLVTINQVQPILVRFSANESDLSLIRTHYASGRPLAVKAKPPQDGTETKEQGRLTALDNSVDVQTGMITLQAQFDNADFALWPGQYVQVRLTLDVEKNQLVVPSDALISRQDGAFVFLAGADGKAELRKVKTGRFLGGKEVIVLEGLEAGDKIITEGIIRVTPGAPVNIVAAGGAK